MEKIVIHEGIIQTYSGEMIDIQNPDPDTINIVDIAHALSMTCRFGGHTKNFYCVAQHSYEVAQRTKSKLQLTALLHDAPEAYLVDLPRPIKELLPEYKELERNLMQVIAEKYKIIYPFPEEIIDADNKQLLYEQKHYLNSKRKIGETPGIAKYIFLKMFEKYSKI